MPPSNVKKPSPKKPAAPSKAAAAFAKIEPEIEALKSSELVPTNINIPTAVCIALGALPNLDSLRPAIVKELPHHPIEPFDKLESYALGAWYAHLLALPAASAQNPVKPLLDEALELRSTLLSDADALVRRKLLDPEAVKDIHGGQGDVDTASDLVALSALFTASWAAIEDRTAATLVEIKRAGDLGPALLAALGVREAGAEPMPGRDAADRRARAFTLFVRAYDAVRRAVFYLRWNEGDADVIAPSLYRGRAWRSSPEQDGDEGDPAASSGAADSGPAG